jgi:hypothetical protein
MSPIGHFAIAFSAKPATQKIPLWFLLIAAELLDLLNGLFQALHIENLGVNHIDLSHGITTVIPATVPWSHGLFMALIWSLASVIISSFIFHERQAGIIIGLTVFSHWILDFIVHAPDLPLLFQNSPKVGLGLWTTGPGFIASMILEFCLLAGGIAFYASLRKRKTVRI